MSVIRVYKNKNYTCMSNIHLQDRELSLKAKGLLSLVLSLPDTWKYSIRGLASICKESTGCVSSVLNELEEAGYLTRSQLRDENGRLKEMEYVFHETSNRQKCEESIIIETNADCPCTEEPCAENPDTVNPDTDEPKTENPAQSNSNESNTESANTEVSKYSVIRFPESEEEKREAYSDMIRENIAFDRLAEEFPEDKGILEELFSLMQELIMSQQETVRIARKEYPAEMVRGRILKLNEEHIRTIMERLKERLPHAVHRRQYMMTVLFNALNNTAGYHPGSKKSQAAARIADEERKRREDLVRKVIEKDRYG